MKGPTHVSPRPSLLIEAHSPPLRVGREAVPVKVEGGDLVSLPKIELANVPAAPRRRTIPRESTLRAPPATSSTAALSAAACALAALASAVAAALRAAIAAIPASSYAGGGVYPRAASSACAAPSGGRTRPAAPMTAERRVSGEMLRAALGCVNRPTRARIKARMVVGVRGGERVGRRRRRAIPACSSRVPRTPLPRRSHEAAPS